MTRKIIKIGDSAGVTIPKSIIEKLDLEVGEEVEVRDEGDKVVLKKPQTDAVDKELLDWTDEFIGTHREALEKLADK
jgi:putative addiction module antidote